ncbi:MAG: DotH/IcmK family type IV secretion protein [Desulfobacteraceae bacterium]|nr:DotH/IcmK family type IV secretion protein [Desulfobacteraceae bacterium]
MKNKLMCCLLTLFLSVAVLTAPAFAAEAEEKPSSKDKAFERSLNGQFPMTPEQIEKLKRRMNGTKKAVHKRTPPKMINRTRRLSFETGKKSPVVRIAPGYVTTISFFDSTGRPWPVTSVVLGNPNYYNVQRPDNQNNVITIAALKDYVDSNLALTFKSQHMPSTIQLKTVSGQDGEETDSLVVFRADQRGPNAEQPMIGPEPDPTIDSVLMQFLDNVPPEEARRIRLLSGGDSGHEAREDRQGVALWSYQDSLYLRTRHPLTWPAWNAVAKGPGGVRVYELSRVPSLMISDNGGSVVYDVGETFYDQ